MKLVLFLIFASVFVSIISLSYAEEITPKYPIMKNFPYDSQKGVEYYLERYYFESIYKTWFHNNFNGSIEEALGLLRADSVIKEEANKCSTKAVMYRQDWEAANTAYWTTGAPSHIYNNFYSNCIGKAGSDDYNNVAIYLTKIGLHKEAIIIFDKALDLNNNDAVIIANKAVSLFELGEFEEVEKMFDRALMLDPQNKKIIMLSESIKNEIKQNPKKYNSIQTTSNDIICGTGTIYKDGQCIVDRSTSKSLFSKGGGCLIATATYGSESAPQVQQLRELRDNSLLQTESGTSFMNSFNDFYYSFSPVIADYERKNPIFREAVKITITPLITSLSILNYVDMDSEVEVLGYGISLILLNIGMYLGIPIVGIIVIKRKLT